MSQKTKNSKAKPTRGNAAKRSPSKKQASAEQLKILLLENIHPAAAENFRSRGQRRIERESGSLDEVELLKMLSDVQILGIRSKTQISEPIQTRLTLEPPPDGELLFSTHLSAARAVWRSWRLPKW
jgi:hypothetical protein